MKSFLLGYIFVPVAFYGIDMICQVLFFKEDPGKLVLLTMILFIVALFAFWLLIKQKYFLVRSLPALAVGAGLGLWHLYNFYTIIGFFGVFRPAPLKDLSFTFDDWKYLAECFVNPFLNLDRLQCDGALAAVVLSTALFFLIALKPKIFTRMIQ